MVSANSLEAQADASPKIEYQIVPLKAYKSNTTFMVSLLQLFHEDEKTFIF